MSSVEVVDLYKNYGEVEAVRGVSFTIEPGEVVALLGPNGAGKSSVVEILEGHRSLSSGSVSVLGYDPHTAGPEFRDRVGIVLQDTGVDQPLSVRETLEIFGGLYSNPRPIAEVVELVGLTEKIDSRIKTLSGGQQRRVDLALGLVGNPDLIFLDEPTTGFDPSARRQAWSMLSGLRALGKTILLTTHYMEEAQQLADRVIVMRRGEIVASGAPEELAAATNDTVVSFRLPPDVSASALPAICAGQAGPVISITTDNPTAAVHAITGWAVENGYRLDDLNVQRPSLEDIYLELVT